MIEKSWQCSASQKDNGEIMGNTDNKEIYKTAMYLRLSKGDGDVDGIDKAESNSITNQRMIILGFLEKHQDLKLVDTYIDDGYTGTNFDRPELKRMIADIDAGKIDAIVCKDLSRFGRARIETGNYIAKIFKQKGIRFIAINDNYDTLMAEGSETNIVMPVKTLTNDNFSRDISTKVRSSQSIKREKGDYIGAFAPYGYMKSEKNRNRLVPDPGAAGIVSEYNSYKISKLLTDDMPEIDMFNREAKAIQVAEEICNDSRGSLFNIGIIGEWGTGKSTLLNMIKKKLSKQKDVIEISYDASSYSEQNQIWANFAKILFERYEQEVIFPNLRYTFSKIKKSPKKYLNTLLVNMIIWIVIFLLAWGSQLSFSINSLISKFSGFGFSLVGIMLLLSKIVFPWAKKLLETSIPLSKKVANIFKLPSYVEVLGTREQVAKELDILFQAWIPKENQKVVIFVDELDRCSEKGIVEFFQSIQLFYGTKKIMFIFAIEPSHLKRALAKNFEIGDQLIEEYTNNYLEKYISYVVPIDNKDNFAEYAVGLIIEINDEGYLKITEKEIEQIKMCINCIHDKFVLRPIPKRSISHCDSSLSLFLIIENYYA